MASSSCRTSLHSSSPAATVCLSATCGARRSAMHRSVSQQHYCVRFSWVPGHTDTPETHSARHHGWGGPAAATCPPVDLAGQWPCPRGLLSCPPAQRGKTSKPHRSATLLHRSCDLIFVLPMRRRQGARSPPRASSPWPAPPARVPPPWARPPHVASRPFPPCSTPAVTAGEGRVSGLRAGRDAAAGPGPGPGHKRAGM